MALSDMRKDYGLAGLLEKDVEKNPFRQFERWFQEAEAAKINEPNAMTLATVSRDGRPGARTVLLKGCDGRGFVFYTNYESRKGRELETNSRATLLFPWIAMERQIIIEGSVTRVSREETEAYFHSRPRASQAGRLGFAPEHGHRRPGGDRGKLSRGGKKIRRPRSSGSAAMGWVATRPRTDRILAGPPQPLARPLALST